MSKLLRRVTYWLRRRRAERELKEEIELHRALQQERFEQAGMTAEDARYASRRVLGNTSLAVEDARDVWFGRLFEQLGQNLRFGLRVLRREPTFAATAVLTLALGIGATTAVFSIVEFEMWKPLPFPRADRLVDVYTTGTSAREGHVPASPPEILDWQAQNNAFVDLAASGNRARRVARAGETADSLVVDEATPNFFSLLGRGAARGRTFGPEDNRAPNVIVLTDTGWRRNFDADPNIVGREITLNDVPHTIIGVLPAGALEFTSTPDAYVALPLDARHDRADRTLNVIGRLKDGVTLQAAEADLRAVTQGMARAYPTVYRGRGIRIEDLGRSNAGYNWRLLFFLLGAAIFVLVLTCVNVANLLVARALGREREFAIRRAIGAGRTALVRQLIVEGTLIAIPGGALGLLIAAWAVDLMPAWMPSDFLGRGTGIVLDYRVYLFAMALSGCIALLFGLAPATLTSRSDLNPLLVQGSRALGGSPVQRRMRHGLVVVEMMISLVLLVAAGLFVSSYAKLLHAPLGFDPDNRLTMRVTLAGASYADASTAVPFAERLIETVRAVPGVRDAAVGSTVPLASGQTIRFARPETTVTNSDGAFGIVRSITPHYMRTLGIKVVAGREFAATDVNGAPRVALINETLARQYFAGEDPIGRELDLISEGRARWVRTGRVLIVGVVGNVKNVSVHEVDFNNVFVPLTQHPLPTLQLIVATSIPVGRVVEPVRQAAATVDKRLPIVGVQTMNQMVSDSLRSARFNLLLLLMFGGLAMLMAALGIYGTMSYSMAQRIQEFGVRLALGAQRASILRLALGQATSLSAAGMLCGIALSLIVARIIGDALYLVPRVHSGVLYGVSTTDPFTLTIAGMLLLAISVVAAIVPARRAMQLDPIIALRGD